VSEYDDLIERLATIEEDLRDRAYDRLRRAASATDEDELRAAKADERSLLQARRAIARAIGALNGMTASDD
jgi:hypothetical protein